jgi:hypothetical protein
MSKKQYSVRIPGTNIDTDDLPDRNDIPDGDPSDLDDTISELLVLANLVARQGRVISANQENGDLTVDIVVSHRNILPGYADREIARVRAIMVAISGNPFWTTIKQIPSEGLKRATEIQSREKIGNRRHFIGGGILPQLPKEIRYGDYMYRIKVVGSELGPYTDK